MEKSGGSAANTIVGVAGFGGRAAFVGKVKDDKLGQAFAHDIRKAGVAFDTPPAKDGPATACCYVMVTPDGERTMNTYLGAAQNLYPADVDAGTIAASAFTYLEGYLWDPPHAKEAFRKAATIAHEAGRKVALTLSDAFCVGRYRAEFVDLIKTGTVDLVFANESELKSLYETADFDTARGGIARRCAARGGDAEREGLRRRQQGRRRSRCRRRRSTSWSTRPARATCSRRASCSGSRAAAITRPRRSSARSPRPR